jgi:ABC-2 type transport system permease protein
VTAVAGGLLWFVLVAYLTYFWVAANPDHPLGIALSMLPPFAPVLMPARMATGDAQAWHVVVAVVLTLGAIAAMNALASRIYSNSVLRIGSRVKLFEAWRGSS